MRKLLFATGFLLVSNTLLAADSGQQVLAHLVQQVALPAHAQWQQASQQFYHATEVFCAGNSDLAAVRDSWRNTQRSWNTLQPALVPPGAADQLGLQVQFWPDKRNLAQKQTEELLGKNEPVTAERLATGSVALRGLSASEYILFDQGHDLADAKQRQRYCTLLKANTTYQFALSLHLLQVWQQEFAQTLSQVPNQRFADAGSALAELLRADVTALDVMKKKLGMAIGQPGDGAPQVYQAEAWRSGHTLASLQAGVAGSRALWEGNGFRVLAAEKNPALVQAMDDSFASLQASLKSLQQPLPALLGNAAGQQALKALYAQLDALHRLHEKELAKTLGVQLGFNGTDGD